MYSEKTYDGNLSRIRLTSRDLPIRNIMYYITTVLFLCMKFRYGILYIEG